MCAGLNIWSQLEKLFSQPLVCRRRDQTDSITSRPPHADLLEQIEHGHCIPRLGMCDPLDCSAGYKFTAETPCAAVHATCFSQHVKDTAKNTCSATHLIDSLHPPTHPRSQHPVKCTSFDTASSAQCRVNAPDEMCGVEEEIRYRF